MPCGIDDQGKEITTTRMTQETNTTVEHTRKLSRGTNRSVHVYLASIAAFSLLSGLNAQIFTGDFGVAANASVAVGYPSTGPGSLGNEASTVLSDFPAAIPNGHVITAGVSANQSGTDSSGVFGLVHASLNFLAQPGLLLGTAQASAESSTPKLSGDFLHAGAAAGLNGASQADFWDTVTFLNPNLPLGATLTYRAVLDLRTSVNNAGQGGALAVANFGVGFNGSGLQLHATDYSSSYGSPSIHDAPVEFTVANGAGANLKGYLQMHADAHANGAPPTAFVSSSAGVDAANSQLMYGAYFEFEAVTPDSVVESASGHNYLAVPEPGSSASMAGALSLCGALIWRRYRRIARF